MTKDRDLQRQMARDLRFLAYRHGWPTAPALLFFGLIAAGLAFVFFASFIAEIFSVVGR